MANCIATSFLFSAIAATNKGSGFHLQVNAAQIADLDPVELEHALRGFLLKLQFADAWMRQLPEGAQLHAPIITNKVCLCHTACAAGCTFEVSAYTTDRSSLPLQLWVEDEERERRLGAPEPTITPIKSAKVGTDAVQIQLYAEC